MNDKHKTLLKDLVAIAKSRGDKKAKAVNHHNIDFISLNNTAYLIIHKQGYYELVVDTKGVIKTEKHQSMSSALQSLLLTLTTK